MAEGFTNHYAKGKAVAYSSGSKPSGIVNPHAIEVMKESGIDISSYRSKGFDELPIRDFDYVITMGCKDVCPFFPARESIEWDIEDPKDKGMDKFREARDKIKKKVFELIETSFEKGGREDL